MCHAYMYGLGGAEKGKVKKLLVFKAFLKVSKGPGGAQECKEAAEKYHSRVTLEPFWGHFGGTLEQLLVYSGDFGPL